MWRIPPAVIAPAERSDDIVHVNRPTGITAISGAFGPRLAIPHQNCRVTPELVGTSAGRDGCGRYGRRMADAPQNRSVASAAATHGAGIAGMGVGAIFRHVARWREARPLHPRGIVSHAMLVIDDGHEATGIDVLDTPGEHPCLVRLSRAIGLPTEYWDIPGLAVRLLGAGPDGRDGDLLFAGTGLGPVSRHVLAIRPRLDGGALTTLWPYRTNVGSVMLAVYPLTDVDEAHPEGARFAVGRARRAGAWTPIGTLDIREPRPDHPDGPTRFDSVARSLRGAGQFPWVEAIRAPSYSGARRGWAGGRSSDR